MRFEYDRLNGQKFRAGLDEAGISHKAFARIYGANLRTVERWLKDEVGDIPQWVSIVIGLMVMAPETRSMARSIAAATIKIDKAFPDRGTYPYLAGRELPQDIDVGED